MSGRHLRLSVGSNAFELCIATIMVQAYCVVGLQRPKSDYEGLQHAAVSRVERAIYREKEALPAGQRQ